MLLKHLRSLVIDHVLLPNISMLSGIIVESEFLNQTIVGNAKRSPMIPRYDQKHADNQFRKSLLRYMFEFHI